MDIVPQWLTNGGIWLGLTQLLLDVALLGFVIYLVVRRPQPIKGAEQLIGSLDKIIDESQSIAAEFENNLRERQALTRRVLEGLDERLEEARALCRKLEELQKRSAAPSRRDAPSRSLPRNADHEKILQLAGKGLGAEAIAKRVGKPVGEVELILNLEKLSSAS